VDPITCRCQARAWHRAWHQPHGHGRRIRRPYAKVDLSVVQRERAESSPGRHRGTVPPQPKVEPAHRPCDRGAEAAAAV